MGLVLSNNLSFGGFGGGDKHNLGWYVDQEALETAHPTGNDGDYAVLGSTDTVWVWDSDSSAWVDTDTKGQVTTVNNQTGDVVVQDTLVSGTNIKTINGHSVLGSGNLEIASYLNFPSSWPTTSATTTKAFCDAVAEDTTAIEGKMYLGEVRWSDLPASMVNAEVSVNIMKGSTASSKVILLEMTSGNRAPYKWQYTYWNHGSDVSGWIGFVPTTNTASKVYGTDAQGLQTTYDVDYFGQVKSVNSKVGIVVLDAKDVAAIPQLSVVPEATSENVGTIFQYTGETTNSYVNGYFYKSAMVSVLNSAEQVSELPEASAEEEGNVYQYVGETTSDYINGNYYKCTSDGEHQIIFGQDPVETFSWKEILTNPSLAEPASSLDQVTTAENEGKICLYTGETNGIFTNDCFYKCVPVGAVNWDGSISTFYMWKQMETVESSYGWVQINVQPTVDPLPSQAGQAGKFLTTDGTNVSWAEETTVTFRTWAANE